MSMIDLLHDTLATGAAPWVNALGLRVVETSDELTKLVMPVSPQLVHGGGVLCGQAMMAAADTAMVAAISAALGGFKPMTTVQLQTTFLRPVPGDAGEAHISCRILRKGKNLIFGEIEISTPDGRLCAHATTTYALI
jgi:uncharacterized protein (TIGR00369 family)